MLYNTQQELYKKRNQLLDQIRECDKKREQLVKEYTQVVKQIK